MNVQLDDDERQLIQRALRDEADTLRRMASGRPREDRDDLLDKAEINEVLADKFGRPS